jgi:Domain of unknown function (DUF4157)
MIRADAQVSSSKSPAAPPLMSFSRAKPGSLQRCGSKVCAPGTCSHDVQEERSAAAHSDEAASIPSIVKDVLSSGGRPLDSHVRSTMERGFGHDFRDVRVHADAEASKAARAVGAIGYTVGRHVVLDASHYEPTTGRGKRLLAHELAHVVQQSGAFGAEPVRIGAKDDVFEREAELAAARIGEEGGASPLRSTADVQVQRAMMCSKRLDAPVVGWFFNHAYIDDTGRNDCLGRSQVGNYAIQTLVSGNFARGCAAKTDMSTDPQAYTPNSKPCEPKPGVADVSACLRSAFNAYADPSIYRNPSGPNSNTFAATLARACCADPTSSGLGRVPGWDHAPAGPCPPQRTATCEPEYLGMGAYMGSDCIIRQGAGPKM